MKAKYLRNHRGMYMCHPLIQRVTTLPSRMGFIVRNPNSIIIYDSEKNLEIYNVSLWLGEVYENIIVFQFLDGFNQSIPLALK